MSAPRRVRAPCAGFSLIELVVVIAIMVTLAGIITPVAADRLQRARDARRLTDLKTVVQAIDDYLIDTGTLPNGDVEGGPGGWDTSMDGAFLTQLVTAGYLREPLRDPLNDAQHHYAYYHYPAGFAGIPADFYVVGILNFETSAYAGQTGSWRGPGHDWTADFAYVAGGTSY
ncbi:MAG TPA: prepilin-type N-terminal cleavage/methylation domain-containing protein [Planctomycetota bacterium]|nr:prepilin-type N-terminal cleavage/methylation domain-containing protein [Planctomycetota bacterium]